MDNEQKQASSIEGMRDRIMPTDATRRKAVPMARGLLDYFPDALTEVAHVSFIGNQQHNPGKELHWDKEKSTDHADCIMRHLVERGTWDTDGTRHSTKIAWRALALLQIEIEKEQQADRITASMIIAQRNSEAIARGNTGPGFGVVT